jgi:AraC family transcriptional regulator, positive regulator of tynA and feaB
VAVVLALRSAGHPGYGKPVGGVVPSQFFCGSEKRAILLRGRITAKKMSQLFSTDLIPVSSRLDAWYSTAKQICGDCRFYFPKQSAFYGSIERRTVAGLDLTRFSSSPLSFDKFPVVSASSPDRCCIIITQLEGVRRYCQEGTVAVLKPGDSTLLDSGRPWSSNCPRDCVRLYLRAPLWFVENRLRLTHLPPLPRIPGASGLGAILFRLASALYDQAEILTPEEEMAAVEAYLDILSGCIGNRETGATLTGRNEMCSRLAQFIETHLADPALSPASVASAVGISLRHLQRLFAASGSTAGEWIRERRLERCWADLSDPRFRGKSITEISFFWGFSDSAHFSRSFKTRFGVTPRTFRSCVAWSDSWGTRSPERPRLLGPVNTRQPQPN